MKRMAMGVASMALGLGGSLAMSTPAQAAPLVTGGVVNVTVTDVVDDVTVTVQDVNVGVGAALNIAANVCDVNVNVLAEQLRDGSTTCENATNDQTVAITQL
jgi:hypothetical protein